jgi:hypothetical protein
MELEPTITIEPNGVTLCYLDKLGNCLQELARLTREIYATHDDTKAKKVLKRANYYIYMLNLYEIDIKFDRIKNLKL